MNKIRIRRRGESSFALLGIGRPFCFRFIGQWQSCSEHLIFHLICQIVFKHFAPAQAIKIDVPPGRINEIVRRRRRITADTAMRLARFFDMTPQYWIELQADYDLDVAQPESYQRFFS